MSKALFNPAELLPTYLDGWYNIMTGFGLSQMDRRVHTQFALTSKLDDATLVDLYEAEGLATQIIDVPTEDMIRKWFYISTDTDNKIINAIKKRSGKKKLKTALRWADLFGGAVIFIGINDGRKANEPVNEDNIMDIAFLEVYDKRNVSWEPSALYTNNGHPKYGMPEIYTLTNSTTGVPFNVHESRILRFEGKDLPNIEKARNNGWGNSRLQQIFTRLRGVCDSLGGVEVINTEFIKEVLKVNNLAQLLSNTEGEESLRTRLKALDLTKHALNTTVVDKNEELERLTSIGVSGLRELVDVLIDVLCGISQIPRVKLIGDQSKGLGGESAGNIRMYYDSMAGRQEDDLLEQLTILCRYFALAKSTKYSGDVENLPIVFNDLWVPTAKEIAETRLINAKSDSTYIEAGLPAEYVFYARFGGQSYGEELRLPEEYIKMIKEMSVEEVLENQEDLKVKDNKKKEEDEK